MNKANAVGWFDIYVSDMARATQFYETMLGVKLEALPDPTGQTQMMSFPGEMAHYGAMGALVKAPYAQPGQGGTMVYFSVDDCATQEARAVQAGGAVIRPKFSIGQFGFVLVCQDPEGNLVGFNSMK